MKFTNETLDKIEKYNGPLLWVRFCPLVKKHVLVPCGKGSLYLN
jgi:hypothetical protein